MTKPATTTLWCVTDDKPGHKSQLRGLVNALSAQTSVVCHWLSINDAAKREAELTPPHSNYPGSPTLILAAGSSTHWPALKLRWRFGGKLVVLMKPSLPRFLFDLCIIPQHDGVKDSPRVITTQGALNPVRPSTNSDPSKGLLLIGGPSKHYGWSDTALVEQLNLIVDHYPEIDWTLTTSRRTPNSFLTLLAEQASLSNITVVPLEKTDAEWLTKHYQHCGTIWVTEDSVSMIYESLSSGATTGIIPTPRLRQNRVSMGVDQLIAEGRVAHLSDGAINSASKAATPLREADRVAELIVQRLLSDV